MIQLMFLGGMLVLSMTGLAMAETSAAKPDEHSGRKGGQAGQEIHSEKRSIDAGVSWG